MSTVNTTMAIWTLGGSSPGDSTFCQPKSRSSFATVVYGIWAGITVGINLVILVAMRRRWKLLQRNLVYSYVCSYLLCAMIIGIIIIYDVILMLYNFEQNLGGTLSEERSFPYNSSVASHKSIMQWFAFRRSYTCGLGITCSLNIAALVYGVSTTSQFVGRYTDTRKVWKKPSTKRTNWKHKKQDSKTAERSNSISRKDATRKSKRTIIKESLKLKRANASKLILVTWLVPIVLSLPTAFNWNCLEYCQCLPGSYEPLSCRAGSACSRLWEPTHRTYLVVSVAIWLLCNVVNYALLLRTIRAFYTAHSFKSSPSSTRSYTSETKSPTTRPYFQSRTSHLSASSRFEENFPKKEAANTERRQSLYMIMRSKRPPLHSAVKLTIIMVIAHSLLFGPIAIFLFIDGVAKELHHLNTDLIVLVSVTLYAVYLTSAPIILLIYLPGVRSAVKNLSLICFGRKVKTTKRSNWRASQKRNSTKQADAHLTESDNNNESEPELKKVRDTESFSVHKSIPLEDANNFTAHKLKNEVNNNDTAEIKDSKTKQTVAKLKKENGETANIDFENFLICCEDFANNIIFLSVEEASQINQTQNKFAEVLLKNILVEMLP